MPSSASTIATHTAKRPYGGIHSQTQTQHQSTITSYFSSSSSSLPPNAVRNDSYATPRGPALPPLIQSNLLSVGMRVRKSVPEGYKTGPPRKHSRHDGAGRGVGLVSRWSDIARPGPAATASGAPAPAPTPARRELTPFCGLLKVGGLAVQHGWDRVGALADGDEDDEGDDDVVPFLSSQDSTASISSIHSRMACKRRFEDVGEEEPQLTADNIWRDVGDDVQLSPKTGPVDLQLGIGSRAMAVPRSRSKSAAVKNAVLYGQENVNLGILDVDFGEAEFMDWSSCLAL